MDVLVLADAPADADERSRVLLARFGRFYDRRYGRFEITAEMARTWERNLREHFGGEVPIDLDHSPEKQGRTEAAGWIKGLEIANDGVYADVEWTSLGAEVIREKRYRYVSPTFLDAHKDERGRNIGPALIGMALTNRPFLRRDMPAVSLSRDDLAFAERTGEPSDSRPRMTLLDQIREALELGDDADEAKALEAVKHLTEQKPLADVAKALELDDADGAKVLDEIKALREKATEKPPEPPEGKTLVDATLLDQLKGQAAAGAEAARELDEMRFARHFDKAVEEGRAAPKSRDQFKALYDADADNCVKVLDELPKIVSTESKGSGKGAGEETPSGVDEDAHTLDTRVKTYMVEHKVDYPTALDAVVDEREGATA